MHPCALARLQAAHYYLQKSRRHGRMSLQELRVKPPYVTGMT